MYAHCEANFSCVPPGFLTEYFRPPDSSIFSNEGIIEMLLHIETWKIANFSWTAGVFLQNTPTRIFRIFQCRRNIRKAPSYRNMNNCQFLVNHQVFLAKYTHFYLPYFQMKEIETWKIANSSWTSRFSYKINPLLSSIFLNAEGIIEKLLDIETWKIANFLWATRFFLQNTPTFIIHILQWRNNRKAPIM